MAAMRSIAAFGVVKRKCVGTRSRRSRRSTARKFCASAQRRHIVPPVLAAGQNNIRTARRRRSRRSIPVSHILYNVSTPGRRARRPGGFYGSWLGRMEDGGGKERSCKTAISGIFHVFTLFSSLMVFSSVFLKKVQFFRIIIGRFRALRYYKYPK